MVQSSAEKVNPERFDDACASLAGALERFATLTAQIAAEFRTGSNPSPRVGTGEVTRKAA